MKIYVIVALAIGIFTIHQANAHDDEYDHEGTSGGPCWINELPVTPYYCLFAKGDRDAMSGESTIHCGEVACQSLSVPGDSGP